MNDDSFSEIKKYFVTKKKSSSLDNVVVVWRCFVANEWKWMD